MQPYELLECNTSYTVTVAGATDLAGNALPAPTTWSFTTAADCDEPRTTASVASGAYATAQDVTLACDDGAGSGCARIVYTTDGSVPGFTGGSGTVVSGATAGPIHLGPGETVLRFRAEDNVGHEEVIRERHYSISLEGFTYLAAGGQLLRGAARVPAEYFAIDSLGVTDELFRDAASGRLYRRTNPYLGFSEDDVTWNRFSLRTNDGLQPYLTAAAADGSRIYAGSDKGLFLSIDGGATFQERHFGIYDQDWVTHIALSGKHVYVATRQGMLVSHDRFRTYARRSLAEFTRVTACGDHVYATHAGGVDVSHDAGVTWTTVTTAAGATANRDVACAGTSVYVATNAGLAISTDRGDHFTAVRTTADGLDTDDVKRVVAVEAKVYVGTVGSTLDGKSFAVSTDGGTSFTAHLLGIPGHNVDPAAVLVEGSTILVGAFPSLWRSADGGVTFEPADLTGGITRWLHEPGRRLP